MAKSQQEHDTAQDAKDTDDRFVSALQEARYRIAAYVQCKTDAACYGGLLKGPDIQEGKPGMPKAERALMELYKMGEKGRPALSLVLDAAGSSERIVREGIHLALPRIAPTPCKECVDKLGAVLEQQANQTTLDALNAETKIVYNYFLNLK